MNYILLFSVIIVFLILINFIFILQINKLRKINCNLITEKNTYKHYLSNYQEKEYQTINENKYDVALLKAQNVMINSLDIQNIYQEITKIVSETLNIQFSYLLECIPDEKK
ncbi:hypothetical protein [Geminocystis sp.]|uniref:hypothetical protein n=1 Tax=Geminocystis sp. TaxID=2664100 RepID=UPI003593AB4B